VLFILFGLFVLLFFFPCGFTAFNATVESAFHPTSKFGKLGSSECVSQTFLSFSSAFEFLCETLSSGNVLYSFAEFSASVTNFSAKTMSTLDSREESHSRFLDLLLTQKAGTGANPGVILGESWEEMLKEAAGKSPEQQAAVKLLLQSVVPSLVDSTAALIKAIEKEEANSAHHNRLMVKQPSFRPYRPIEPLAFIASYLMRHHPSKATSKVFAKQQQKKPEQSTEQRMPWEKAPVSEETVQYHDALQRLAQ